MTQVKVVKASHEVRCLSGLASQLSRVTSENIKINFRTPETDPVRETSYSLKHSLKGMDTHSGGDNSYQFVLPPS